MVRHQLVVGELHLILTAARPDDLRVLLAPVDVALDEHTVMQPDPLLARKSDLTKRDLPTAPVLAIEILSPCTRRVDLTLKRSRLEAAGCPSYWVVDPDEPSITVWQLQDSEYVEVAHALADQRVDLDAPYPLSFCPADLID